MSSDKFTIKEWKEKAAEKLMLFGKSLNKASANSVYAMVSAITLWPIIEAFVKIPGTTVVSSHLNPVLIQVFGGVGAGLIANMIEQWRRHAKELKLDDIKEELIQWINNSDQRQRQNIIVALENMNKKLETLTIVNQNLDENDKQWFKKIIHEELSKIGSLNRYEMNFQPIRDSNVNIHYHPTITDGYNHLPAPILNNHWKESYLSNVLRMSARPSLAEIDNENIKSTLNQFNIGQIYTALLTKTPKALAEPSQNQEYLSALELVNKHRYLVIQGDPGSGKTTFLNYLAWCLAGNYIGHESANIEALTSPLPDEKGKPYPNNIQQWDYSDIVPVQIIFREFAAQQLENSNQPDFIANAETLWQYIVSTLELKALSDYAQYLHQELKDKGGLILLDGLDEIHDPEPNRKHIKNVIDNFCDIFPKCKIVVTSRTYAYQKEEWKLNNFKDAVLANFTKGQIRQFIDRWYENIAKNQVTDSFKYIKHSESLKNTILKNEKLIALAERPLLLTLMANIHTSKNGRLPEKRESLYDEAVSLLLDRWEKPKITKDRNDKPIFQPELAEWFKTDRQGVRDFMNQLAYDAHKNQPSLKGTADIPVEKIYTGLALINRSNMDFQLFRLIGHLNDRAGLLLPATIEKKFHFPHRTFQEYLAACHLSKHNYPEKIIELLISEPDRWREVILLTAAKACRKDMEKLWGLLDELCDENPPDDNMIDKMDLSSIWKVHIAAQAIVENIQADEISRSKQKKIDRIIAWLCRIIKNNHFPAYERTIAGNHLAVLGDPRKEVMDIDYMPFCLIPYIKNKKYLKSKSFWISKYPVTNAQFESFIKDSGYENRIYWEEAIEDDVWENGCMNPLYERRSQPKDFGKPFNLSNHPVVGVQWYECMAFARWLTHKWISNKRLENNFEIKLPTKNQWIKAARGDTIIPKFPIIECCDNNFYKLNSIPPKKNKYPNRKYSWGNMYDSNFTNVLDTKINTTSSVGCFTKDVSPYGCEEMNGNISEWLDTKNIHGAFFRSSSDKVHIDFNYGDFSAKGEADYTGFRLVIAKVRQ